jgi:hypothetical protein
MLYVDFAAGGKEYKLRLNTRNTIQLEKQLGCNPLAIFGNGDTIPTITTLVSILHSALQEYQHNIGLQDAYNIFDSYLADGNAVTDFLPVVIELYKVSGLIKQDNEKNA